MLEDEKNDCDRSTRAVATTGKGKQQNSLEDVPEIAAEEIICQRNWTTGRVKSEYGYEILPNCQDHDDCVNLRESSYDNEVSLKQVRNYENIIPCFNTLQDFNRPSHHITLRKRLSDGSWEKVWLCYVCGKEFKHLYTLSRHIPIHTGERNYKCNTCGKSFRQLSTLTQHRTIHSGAKPYICEVCTKTFNRVSTLISHRKTHTGEKTHLCQYCGKGFYQKGNLRNHVFTHTNERPYKCDICNKGFNQKSNLMCHMDAAHACRQALRCKVCMKEFKRRTALHEHQLSHKERIFNVRTQTHDVHLSKEIISLKREMKVLSEQDKSAISRMLGNNVSFFKSIASFAIIICPIDTEEMRIVRAANKTPFALLKSAKGIPMLMKVFQVPEGKEMLYPASAMDLKMAGEFISAVPTYRQFAGSNTVCAVQFKVPIVATVIETLDANGRSKITIKSPGPDRSYEKCSAPPRDKIKIQQFGVGAAVKDRSLPVTEEAFDIARTSGSELPTQQDDGNFKEHSNSDNFRSDVDLLSEVTDEATKSERSNS
ncbi:hypothetical protein PR048_028655 [Dryococelus australis]|uniref:C2H2-type domain-containing protein n=1 Tax=Dryococelus australis TaxID=614101 RepID=A0ABQ9GB67_9NEOP|nr:hypothetical protein PR048_028655 [Dryococelus australis]